MILNLFVAFYDSYENRKHYLDITEDKFEEKPVMSSTVFVLLLDE